MTKIILLTFVLILSACASKEKVPKPFIWKASKGEQSFYFLGTMHAGIQLDDFPKIIRKKIAKSQLVAVEVSQETQSELRDAFKKWFEEEYDKLKNPYPNLKNEFSPQAWEGIQFTLAHKEAIRFVRDQGINHPMTEIHPTLLYALVMSLIKENIASAFPSQIALGPEENWYLLSLKQDTEHPLDKQIEEYARARDIEVIGLDNAGQIVKVIVYKENNPFVMSLELLYGPRSNFKKGHDDLEALKSAYLTGKEHKLLGALEKYDHENLILARNKTWFDELIQKEQPTVFVAAGALHFLGEDSLLSLFKDRGFTVKRMSLTDLVQEEE